MRIVLLSTYELGHQPIALARPVAHLAAAGLEARCQDLAVERLDPSLIRSAELVGISVPMHTAMRLGTALARRVRALNPRVQICFFGLYAGLHADLLLRPDGADERPLADSVIGGEFEEPLVELATRFAGGTSLDDNARLPILGVRVAGADGTDYLGRQRFLVPRRDRLPPLDRYARLRTAHDESLVGYVEASRGCAHQCLHCPITPVYRGRLRIIPREVVLEDVRQLVRMGARHITFGDPDFFNGIRHSLAIVDAMHAEFPGLTFDATIKVEHILEHQQHVRTLAARGCAFLVSAVESIHDEVLRALKKGHTGADVVEALEITASAGLPLRPTFVPFTPWTSLQQYLELLDFVGRHGLVGSIDSIQLAIRLLVPRGSALVGTPAMTPFLGPFDDRLFCYVWRHPDPRMDQLQLEVVAAVETALRDAADAYDTFTQIRATAERAAGRTPPDRAPLRAPLVEAPRLTEPWFC